MIKALLMDFNGVVINDEPIQMRVYQEVLAGEGIPLSEADYMASLGMDDRTFVRAAYGRAGKDADDDKVAELTRAKTTRWKEVVADEVPLFPNVENFIRKAANEMTLGLVSMANREELTHILERTGLVECFSIVITAEDVERPKPDPQCYRHGFRAIDLHRISRGSLPMVHSECVVIEDAPPGVRAAVAADLPVLGVANTVSPQELRSAGATWVANDLNDWWPESIRRAFM